MPTTGRDPVGMFHRYRFELPKGLPQANTLAILVSPPDFYGCASSSCAVKGQPFGQGGDHEIARNGPMMEYTAGWDWAQATPDRNTGIWDRVYLEASGPVTVHDPFVQTVAIDHAKGTAALMAGGTITNAASTPVTGTLRLFVVDAIAVRWEGNLTLAAHESREWSSGSTDLLTYPDVLSKLWWPHTHTPTVQLHTMRWTFTVRGAGDAGAHAARRGTSEGRAVATPSHTLDHRFGIRTVRNFHDKVTAGNGFEVNGQRIYLQGGNWISSDQLLRYTSSDGSDGSEDGGSGGGSSGRYYNEVSAEGEERW
jgi:hypothetical protein